mmetsp:Transcript_112426/g.324789  ORF Transcript_112426/g.324789 Transcript_112426/m.324789 type:complete len:177 (-) Transcript_112426:158-688(-)
MLMTQWVECIGNAFHDAAESAGSFFGHSMVQALFVGVLVGLVIGMPGAILVSCMQRLPCWPSSPDDKTLVSIEEDTIERTFPERMPSGDTTPGQSPTCAICLQNVAPTEWMRELQCHHCFHARCIADWWTHEPRTSVRCPLCRQQQILLPGPADSPKRSGCTCLTVGSHQSEASSP